MARAVVDAHPVRPVRDPRRPNGEQRVVARVGPVDGAGSASESRPGAAALGPDRNDRLGSGAVRRGPVSAAPVSTWQDPGGARPRLVIEPAGLGGNLQ